MAGRITIYFTFILILTTAVADIQLLRRKETEIVEPKKMSKQLPTLYQYFTEGDISSGLVANDRDWFELNGKKFRIFSGSLHYFRVHPDYWRDRLKKYRAAGLNAIDVYVPWNLHEPEEGVYDFGEGGRDFSIFLDLPAFLRMAQEEDLFVIFRPGPYICAEWDFGGLPSWFLRKHPIFVRTSHDVYLERATIFIEQVISRVKDLQFYTANGQKGGPIIMTQIENEYGAFGYDDYPRDTQYLHSLKLALESYGMESLLFTSDSPKNSFDYGTTDGVLMTANFKFESTENLDALLALQPNRPILVSEFWPGWFDHWFEPIHNTLNIEDFTQILNTIFNYNGSVNFYMFHGGTNFGFMNGANHIDNYAGNGFPSLQKNKAVFPFYAPDVTSYDYDAPVTENGAYTPKYDKAAEMIATYDSLANVISKPERPEYISPQAYPNVKLNQYLTLEQLLDNVPEDHKEISNALKSMEELNINNFNGQSYGYIVYRKKLPIKQGAVLSMRGRPRDLLHVLVNGVMVNKPLLTLLDLNNFGSWAVRDGSMTIDLTDVPNCTEGSECTLDLVVENLGRTNYGKPHQFQQKKGLWEGPVSIDGNVIADWEIIPLELKGNWIRSLTGWQAYDPTIENHYSPRALKGELTVNDEFPRDTYFDFDCSLPECAPFTDESAQWHHGAFFVNGFNVGRYHQVGPQKTLYVPGPLLKQGTNEIVVVELLKGMDMVKFTDTPNYGNASSKKKPKKH